MNNILVIAAHPDDELLGLGATIRKRVNQGDEANCVILGEGLTSRKLQRTETAPSKINSLHQNAQNAAKIIGFNSIHFESLPDNRFDSVDLLDIIKIVEKYISQYQPNIIYTHHIGDRNIDHRITHEAVLTAARPTGNYSVKEIYTFETPSSTEWGFTDDHRVFTPNTFVDVTDTLKYKLDAMACYKSELRDYPHPRSLEALKIIAAKWGTVVNKKYVETFKLIRNVID